MKPILADFAARVQSFNGIRKDWALEDKCRKCGECCRLKVNVNGTVVALPLFCPALDVETKKCRIYALRHTLLFKLVGRRCQTVARSLEKGEMPCSCAYVEAENQNCWRFDPKRVFEAHQLEALKTQNKEERIKISAYLDSRR